MSLATAVAMTVDCPQCWKPVRLTVPAVPEDGVLVVDLTAGRDALALHMRTGCGP